MYLLLVGLVRQGGRTIRQQDAELRHKVGELDRLLAQNGALHERVRRAAGRTTALNERFLRRISAELHDAERRSAKVVETALGDVPVYAPLAVKITVFRLVQESLTNAYRHGGGCAQQVELRTEEGVLVLDITDNGRGFVPGDEVLGEPRGLGLAGMRERVASLGGVFAVTTALGAGTRVSARILLGEPRE
jgi:signal transduction histidine kinase